MKKRLSVVLVLFLVGILGHDLFSQTSTNHTITILIIHTAHESVNINKELFANQKNLTDIFRIIRTDKATISTLEIKKNSKKRAIDNFSPDKKYSKDIKTIPDFNFLNKIKSYKSASMLTLLESN